MPFARRVMLSRLPRYVGAEWRVCGAGHRPPLKQHVQFSRMQLSRRLALPGSARETRVPQSYAWGVEAQVDWYGANADLAGEPGETAGVRDAQHGERSSLPLRLFIGDAAGLSASTYL